jgi:threonine dehydrogenase-like Zn-dependent dehydrogenase
MAAKSAWLCGAARVINVDTIPFRLDKAKETANSETVLWEGGDGENVIDFIRSITDNRGADVCVEAVGFEPERTVWDRIKATVNFEKGSPKVLEACMSAVRRGGIVSVLGVYATNYDNFPIGQFFDKGITLKGGQAPAQKHIDKLMQYVAEGKVKLNDIITHRLPLSEVEHGYKIFRNKEDNCVKVVMDPWS